MNENFRHLITWQKGMEFAEECYAVARRLPDWEKFGLTSQLQRAAVSVPANIAEGHGSGTKRRFINHLWIANGSLREAETHLLLAQRLGHVGEAAVKSPLELADRVGRPITGLRRSLGRPDTDRGSA